MNFLQGTINLRVEDFDGFSLVLMFLIENSLNDVDQVVVIVEMKTHFLVTIVQVSIVVWMTLVTTTSYVQ